MKRIILVCLLLFSFTCYAQIEGPQLKETLDSLYIHEVEEHKEPAKILHAEPLFIDLIRDLGARKGEKEWNIGAGLTDNMSFDKYTALVEYEWAPVNRLGLEVELPFTFYYPTAARTNGESTPKSRLNSLKMASQYTFLVSEKYNTSMAIGYIHEFELTSFNQYGRNRLLEGNIFNPFYVAAKRWGNNFHTLIYTGPLLQQHAHEKNLQMNWQVNSNVHYMITGTRNFIGIEFNKEFLHQDFDMIIRPQMRLSIADNLLIGILAGIPIKRENERFSTFMRLIYEPGHRAHK